MRTLSWLSLLSIMLMSCGGGATSSEKMSPGTVYLENRLEPDPYYTFVFSYFNEDHQEQVEVTIAAGETKNLSRYELPGGTVVSFDYTNNRRLNGTLTVTVDGTITILLTGVRSTANPNPLIYDIIST